MTGDAQEFWDAIHRGRDPSRPGRPHPYLVEHFAGASTAATALELGCGDGANAIWLASQGWTVTAVDVSQVALDRTAAFADRAGVGPRVRRQRADLRDFATTETFDLVAAFFVHTPVELDHPAIMARAADRVGHDGALLVVGHCTLPPWAWDSENTDGVLSAGDLASALALHEPAWSVRLAKEVERTVEHAGREATILDAVLHAVRAHGVGRAAPDSRGGPLVRGRPRRHTGGLRSTPQGATSDALLHHMISTNQFSSG